MTLEEKKLLADIQTAIFSIDDHLEGRKSFAEYKANKTKRRAVEREFEIIGEATNSLLKINPEISLTNARRIVDFRNKVIHAYDIVDDIIMWEVIMNYLPGLLKEVEQLLSK